MNNRYSSIYRQIHESTSLRLPNFAIIGTAKSGTTSLYHYLNQHPQIYMSAGLKEPNFFAYGEQAIPGFDGPVSSLPDRYAQSLAAYAALFTGASQQSVIGEASTSNLESLRAHERMRHYIPEAKCIVILRHPADRAWSQFLHTCREGWEPCPNFQQAWNEEREGKRTQWWHFLRYYENGLYAQRLTNFYQYFPRNQVRVYLYEQFVQNNRGLLRDIFQFLGVDTNFTPDTSIHHNRASTKRHQDRHKLLKQLSPSPVWLKILLPHAWRHSLRKAVRRVNLVKSPPFDPELRRIITKEFQAEILQLQSVIEYDLAHWLP